MQIQRKVKTLSNNAIVWNDGQDLWDYLFHGTKLKNFEEVVEESEWLEEGIEWLKSQLVEGEEYLLNDNPVYFITSIGRFGNLKYQAFRKLTLQCHSISGNRSGGAFSMTKEVRDHWGIELTYDTLHPAAKDLVTISLRNKQ